MTTHRGYAAGGALLLLALTACGSQTASTSAVASSTPQETSPAASAPAVSPEPATSSAAPAAAPGAYIDYATYTADRKKYSAGKVVLFFHAGWCPTCQKADKNLTSDPASIPAGLTVVKTDFDTEQDLRQKYGVGVQHTFVQIDASGAQLAKWSGSTDGAAIAEKTV